MRKLCLWMVRPRALTLTVMELGPPRVVTMMKAWTFKLLGFWSFLPLFSEYWHLYPLN